MWGIVRNLPLFELRFIMWLNFNGLSELKLGLVFSVLKLTLYKRFLDFVLLNFKGFRTLLLNLFLREMLLNRLKRKCMLFLIAFRISIIQIYSFRFILMIFFKKSKFIKYLMTHYNLGDKEKTCHFHFAWKFDSY